MPAEICKSPVIYVNPSPDTLKWQAEEEEKHRLLNATEIDPWIERLPWQSTHPVRYDRSEGYSGDGIMGSRTGPTRDFSAVAHEMAHAIELLATKDMETAKKRFRQHSWGMRILSYQTIGGKRYYEPTTIQPTMREARVGGIQKRILEIVGHPDFEGFTQDFASTITKYMPDWYMGADTEEQRIQERANLIEESYRAWPAERVQEYWEKAFALLDPLYRKEIKARIKTHGERTGVQVHQAETHLAEPKPKRKKSIPA